MNATWRRRGECPVCGVAAQARCVSLRGTGTLTVARPHPGRPLLSTDQMKALEMNAHEG